MTSAAQELAAGETSTADRSLEGPQPVVLQVVPALETGGVERGTVEVATALAQAGAVPLVASSGGRLVHDLQRVGAQHIELPLQSKNPLVMRRNAKRLIEVIEGYGVHLVHARSRAPAWSAYWATRKTQTPFVTTFHSPYGLSGPFKRRYNSVMTLGDRVISISDFVTQHIKDNYEIDPVKLRLVHRGVDLRSFDPDKVSAERVIQLSTAWRLPDGVPIILLPGRLTRWKGQLLLIDALAQMKQERQFLCLLVGSDQGRSAYREELEKAIVHRGLTDCVAIFDDCRDMPAAYKLSDVVVSASIEPEGFGRVVSEAQAMGRPVVVSNHGGGPEQILADETGYLFDNNNPGDLARALRQALDLSESQRSELGQKATSHAAGNFSTARMCDKTLDVYRELLSQLPEFTQV
ncbi:glycosyltransferase [Rhodovibrionaceae bacterium A322]